MIGRQGDGECPQARVNRFEVIDEKGRVYVRSDILLDGPGVKVTLSYQDDGRTLKVFVKAADGNNT